MIFQVLICMMIGIACAALRCSVYGVWLLPVLGLCRGSMTLVLCGLLVVTGYYYFDYRYESLTSWSLPTRLIKKSVIIDGVVASIPKEQAHAQQFLFEGTLARQRMAPQLIRLSWYQPHPHVTVGEHWKLTVSLRPPSGLHNPGGFDYRRWLILHGVRAVGYVKSHQPYQLLQKPQHSSITRWRESLQEMIHQAIPTIQVAGLIAAITVGSHNLIQPEQWRVFQRTGTNHLMAISGLHIGFVAGFGFLLMGLLWRRSTRLLLWRPVQYAQAVAAIIAAICYGLMAGFSLPTQRAVIMVVIIMATVLFKQAVFLWQRIVFAFCVVLLLDPFALFSASLWLSFGSVTFIAYVCSGRYQSYRKSIQWARLQLALLVGLAPLTVYYFGQVALVGLLANAVAVPWVGFIIIPLCLLAALAAFVSSHAAIFLFKGAGFAITPLWHYLQWLSQQQWAVWQHAIPQVWILIMAVLGAFVVLLPRGVPGRWLGLLLWLPLFCYRLPGPKPDAVWVTTLDVGQGLAMVIQTQHHTLLYDAGPKSYSGFDAGASVVVPYLQYLGIDHLDMMMISHGDNDHIGGSYAVLQSIPTRQILTSVPQKFKRAATYCYRGEHWQWDGVRFNVLWPIKGAPYQDNDSSCVLRISVGHEHVLLTGDIEQPAERLLVQHDPDELRAQLLEAPHHGSKTSSSASFLDAVKPEVVVFSTGRYNRYHFPSQQVVARYQQRHAKMYNTALSGAVSVHINGKGVESVKTARRDGQSLL